MRMPILKHNFESPRVIRGHPEYNFRTNLVNLA
jgi:hypothetical protein